MTSEMRKREEKSGVYLESIRSPCSRTQFTSVEDPERLQKGSLRESLDYLARWIEQQLSSSTTFSTRFSWRLPRGIYPYVVKKCLSSSSMECVELELPMKILDDLAICRMRAKLRAEAVLQTGLTQAEAHGKNMWSKLRERFKNLVESSIRVVGGVVLSSYLEKDVFLTVTSSRETKTWNIIFRGRVDFAAIVNLKDSIFTMLVEVTEYRDAPVVTKNRLQAYASALYGELGFPVVPVLIILGEHEMIKDVQVLKKNKILVPGIELRRIVNRLIRTLTSEEVFKVSSRDLCVSCDPSIRRLCPYQH